MSIFSLKGVINYYLSFDKQLFDTTSAFWIHSCTQNAILFDDIEKIEFGVI